MGERKHKVNEFGQREERRGHFVSKVSIIFMKGCGPLPCHQNLNAF